MRSLFSLLGRFRSDEGGAFIVLFAVMGVVLVATAGAVVDFTSLEQARNRAQVALDAAALALQPSIYTSTTTTIQNSAQALLVERLNDSSITASIDTVTVSVADGQLKLDASITVPMAFVSLVGIPTVRARLVSEATRKKLNLEVAMVLDNSGSMSSSSRMTNLKAAANSATDILFSNAATQPNVFIGVAPFTEIVNVGTAYKTATWMDQTGVSGIANDNFDNDDDDATVYSGAVNRFALYTAMGVAWTGCVEARKPPYDTDDTAPSVAAPDTLFVPILAPDQPDSGYSNSYLSDNPAACSTAFGSCAWQETKTGCNKDGTSCTGATTVASTFTATSGATTTNATACNCTSIPALAAGANSISITSGPTKTSSGSSPNKTFVTKTSCNFTLSALGLSDRELQERMCKYTGATVSIGSGFMDGPNSDCPGAAVLPLTNVSATVKSRIAAMNPDGGTNIHQGVVWGFHMLSPTEPLTEAKPYDSATSKVMIVMTDGENTNRYVNDMNGADWYTAYGYPYNGRLTGNSTTALQTEMDNRTKTTCANAKAAGITIYTIGLSPPNQSTIDMLTACASDPSNAYFPVNSSDLTAVFTTIARQLADLRLAR